MNRKTVSAITAAVLLCASQAAVSAQDSDIKIYYNGDYMTYTDAVPQIINDRTMLPFRQVLETMGAEVSFDDATRTVGAKRGETEISFSLDGTAVHISRNGNTTTLNMDAAPVVENGRTLVPVRFMSEALGMRVGWDADVKTVSIVDFEKYLNEIKEKSDVVYKILTASAAQPDKYSGSDEITAKVTTADGGSMEFSTKAQSVKNGGNQYTGTFSVKADKFPLVDAVKSKVGIDMGNLSDVNYVIRKTADTTYFQSNVISELNKANPNAGSTAKLALAFMEGDLVWYDVDSNLIELMKNSGFNIPADTSEIMDILSEVSGTEITGIEQFRTESTKTGDVTLKLAQQLDAAAEGALLMDAEYTENGDGTCTYIVKAKENALKQLPAGAQASAELTVTIKNGFATSDKETVTVKYNGMTLDMTNTQTHTAGTDAAEVTKPPVSTSVTSLFNTAKKFL